MIWWFMRLGKILLVSLVLAGCTSNTGVVKVGADQLMISKQGGGFWVSPTTLKNEALGEANQFCSKSNKNVQVVRENVLGQIPLGMPGGPRFPTAELTFVCLNLDGSTDTASGSSGCYKDIYKNSQVQIISHKVALLSVTDQTFDMLTSKDRATDDEKTAIREWSRLIDDCRKKEAKQYSVQTMPPTLLALSKSSQTAMDNARLMLFNGEITYGQFAQIRKNVADNSEMAEAQIKMELAKQNADAEARAQQLALNAEQVNLAAIQTQMMGVQTMNQTQMVNQQQQMLYNQNRTRVTNCMDLGSSVNCTSTTR
jgi:hypothetical protein